MLVTTIPILLFVLSVLSFSATAAWSARQMSSSQCNNQDTASDSQGQAIAESLPAAFWALMPPVP